MYCEEPDKYIPAVLCMCSHLEIFKDLGLMSGIEKSDSEGLNHLQVCLLKSWYLYEVYRWCLDAFNAAMNLRNE